MTGNVVLDVVIDLAILYVLYSLFATTIMGIISAALGLRARIRYYALSRMLMDEREYKSFFQKFCVRVLAPITQAFGFSPDLTNRQLLNLFYSQPSIKVFSQGGFFSKPEIVQRM